MAIKKKKQAVVNQNGRAGRGIISIGGWKQLREESICGKGNFLVEESEQSQRRDAGSEQYLVNETQVMEIVTPSEMEEERRMSHRAG